MNHNYLRGLDVLGGGDVGEGHRTGDLFGKGGHGHGGHHHGARGYGDVDGAFFSEYGDNYVPVPVPCFEYDKHGNCIVSHSPLIQVFGSSAPSWSNTNAYNAGDHVQYGYDEYVANSPISPPMVPSLMSGEVPGQSASWTKVQPTNVWGDDVLGMFDIGAKQLQMNTLKQVPVSVAMILLKNGQDAINHARTLAASKNLPGGTARDEVYYKLQWHQNTLTPLAATPNAMYGSGNDLKQWVMRAFIESNATDEGASWIDQAWDAMWIDIAKAIAALPKELAAKVNEAASALLGIPTWGWGVALAGLVGLVGYGAYRRISGR